MKKIYSIAMLLMLVASVSFFSSCNKDDDNGVNMGGSDVNGGGSEVETKTYTGTLDVYDRVNEESEVPGETQLVYPVYNQPVNMTRTASTFGLSINDLVLEIIGMGPTPSSNLSISGVPYTVSSSDADLCVVDYVCDVQIDILGTYATVTKIKGSFSKSSNVMELAILATGSEEGLASVPVYISVVCPGTTPSLE